ncbi:MAG: SLC13 family permease [Planctomycetota bacterium]|nr:MAG: SLC13 family permease [Planctomycetota bacterium]
MEPAALFALLVILGVFAALLATRISPERILLAALAVLFVTGTIDASQALVGFSNEGMMTIAVLFIVGAGIKETGAVVWIADRILGASVKLPVVLARIMIPTAFFSALVNNTPLVAMLIPAVRDWARKRQVPASKLMIPLSYAAILGGTCTIIGTSTNLVVNGLLIEAADAHVGGATLPRGFSLFEIAWVGLPITVAGIGFLLLTHRYLLPERGEAKSIGGDPREYTIEMLVEAGGPLVGKTIAEAGLRHLSGVYLADVYRDGQAVPSDPNFTLRGNDHLLFTGNIRDIRDLQRIRGLVPATHQVFRLDAPRSERCLIEVTVSGKCPLVEKRLTVRDGRFRSRYDAVILAVARRGERVEGKIGDVVLQAGDTLLLEAHPSFYEKHRYNDDFYVVSRIQDSNPPRFERAVTAFAILGAMVALVTLSQTAGNIGIVLGSWHLDFGQITMLKGAVLAAVLMLITRCCTLEEARRNIDFRLLLAIAAAFGLGKALEATGAAHAVSSTVTSLASDNPHLALGLVYVLTAIMTELVTNNAAAALMFPFAMATASDLGVSPLPFLIVVMIAASASFATPLGYQTNLMVYGAGNYRFRDFLIVGIPMSLLVMIITLVITPWVWPF